MNVEERIKLCRVIDKMEDKGDLVKRLGLENRSKYKGKLIEEPPQHRPEE